MIRDHFRVLRVDLSTGRGQIEEIERSQHLCGRKRPCDTSVRPDGLFRPRVGRSGTAVDLRHRAPHGILPADEQGRLRLQISLPRSVCREPRRRTVSPVHAVCRPGCPGDHRKAKRPSCLVVGSRTLEVKDVHYLWGKSVQRTGQMLRRLAGGSGHRSILRIGRAGENRSAMACINVDTYRHFGRLGVGRSWAPRT